MCGGGPFDLKPGQWTDDTSMALALAESLIAHPDLDPVDLMLRFTAWMKDGAYSCTGTCFDIGIVTRNSLGYFQRTGDPFAGSPAPDRAGNGSLMRVAPVALRALEDDALAARITGQIAGAVFGASSIPVRWLEPLAWRDQLETLASQLMRTSIFT